MNMTTKKKTTEQDNPEPKPTAYRKLNIVTMGGKGGVGKTTFMSALVEWFQHSHIPAGLLDLDTENRTKGGLQFFHDEAEKVNVRERDGLDVFLDTLEREEVVVLADMGAGQGDAATAWFKEFYAEVSERGGGFLMVGLVTNDPASVGSVLQWEEELRDYPVKYLIVFNEMNEGGSEFEYWHKPLRAQEFEAKHQPYTITMKSRLPEMQNYMSDHRVTLQTIAEGKAPNPEFRRIRALARAKTARDQLFKQFDQVIAPLLPQPEE